MTPSGPGPDSAASIVDHRLLIKIADNEYKMAMNLEEMKRDVLFT